MIFEELIILLRKNEDGIFQKSALTFNIAIEGGTFIDCKRRNNGC